MRSDISRTFLWASLSLLLIAAAIRVGRSAGTILADAEDQALIQYYQGPPSIAMTRIESQRLLNDLIAKNVNLSASTGVQPQSQFGGASTLAIAPAASQLPVQAVAGLRKPNVIGIGAGLPKTTRGRGADQSLRLLEPQYLKGPQL
jgi:hypothetical protein